MADPKGFIKYDRDSQKHRDPKERIHDYKEIYVKVDQPFIEKQAARCMDCGVPFCNSGCPLGNLIPDFNDAVYNQDWKKAFEVLSETNNFPEFTGRICPAPCEAACVLGITKDPVTIEQIEKHIIEEAFKNDWLTSIKYRSDTGKKVAVIGSGPAGLAAAAQLGKAGHNVTVYERNEKPGGLLRYGIPDFKLEKSVVDRRVKYMESEGIKFVCNAHVGIDVDIKAIEEENDAIVLCGGSTIPRDLPIDGRDAKGVHFAMEFLEMSNKYIDKGMATLPKIYVEGQDVVVIGGGDTGADCVGTSNRQGAKSVTQIELLSKPGNQRGKSDPWPKWPMILRTSTSHDEGCVREWSILTKRFLKDSDGNLAGLEIVEIEWKLDPATGRNNFTEIEGTLKVLPCSFAFIAAGFLHPQHEGIINKLSIDLDERGNVKDSHYRSNIPHIFSAGDMRRGQSLVVWAISEGREAAREVDKYLMGSTVLESKNHSKLALA
jgi:glutamate synthase (NADPH) small chain